MSDPSSKLLTHFYPRYESVLSPLSEPPCPGTLAPFLSLIVSAKVWEKGSGVAQILFLTPTLREFLKASRQFFFFL